MGRKEGGVRDSKYGSENVGEPTKSSRAALACGMISWRPLGPHPLGFQLAFSLQICLVYFVRVRVKCADYTQSLQVKLSMSHVSNKSTSIIALPCQILVYDHLYCISELRVSRCIELGLMQSW